MPHTGIHAISARQNKMNKRWVCPCGACWCAGSAADICTIYPALDIPFPAIASRCNPRHWRRYHISLCHITILGVGRLGVARRSLAFLGDIDAHKSRCSQISALLAALLAGFAALVALAGVGSHNVQQQLAQVAEPWGGPLHPITPLSYSTYFIIYFDKQKYKLTNLAEISFYLYPRPNMITIRFI